MTNKVRDIGGGAATGLSAALCGVAAAARQGTEGVNTVLQVGMRPAAVLGGVAAASGAVVKAMVRENASLPAKIGIGAGVTAAAAGVGALVGGGTVATMVALSAAVGYMLVSPRAVAHQG